MKKILFPMTWAVLLWASATTFFVLFGHQVLVDPSLSSFWPTLILLEAGTAVCLYLLSLLYIRFDSSANALLIFALCGTATGLFLDTFSISYHSRFFPALSSGQVIAFTAWMSCAYALYITIPLLMHYSRNRKMTRQSSR